MKTKILSTIALLFGLLMTAKAQNSNWNYVHTRTMLTATADSCMDNVVYYDGLGRPFQNAQLHAAPNGQSIVDFTEYDASGRVWKQWNKAYTSGEFMPYEGMSLSYPYIYNDDRCYIETVYDASPLNRATEQYGPGNVWAEHPVNTDYLVNDSTTAELKCLYYSVNTNGTLNANNGASYPTGSLHVVKTTDEDGNVGYVFTDKQERILLERRMNGTVAHDTYYVYDVYGNLCFVLQPMYQDNNSIDLFAFQYKYDHRNRCIWKKLPGAAYVEYVYNNADQLTHSQDGVQRASGKWLYYKYDGFNRMTEWGVTSSKTATTGTAYVKNYYDGYSFIGTTGFTNGNFTSGDTNGRGKLTGSVVTVPELTSKLYKAFYYDEKGRMVKSVESNLMAGYNVVNTTYSFTDKPLTVTRTHNGGMGFSMSETYTYSYDHADRLIKTEHTLNGSTITMAEYTYDNLGRMFSKRLHGKEAFRTDYTYNIRNWLAGISGDLFTQNLHYTDGVGTACYNGNISSMTWQSGNETTTRGYKYTYDGVNRLKNAFYGEGESLTENSGRYTENCNNYDKNGNFGAGFVRNGRISDGSYSTISALVPAYNGNQLQSVNDVCPYAPYEGTFGFDSKGGGDIEYTYDANGNLTQDLNKGISNISYNMLSLPSVVTFSDGSTITYYYDAEGNKVRVIYSITGKTSLQRNYSNGVIYDNGRQQCLFTEEGYIALQENNKYYYYLKDHQGNNRVVVDEDENIVEVNHYYPFGGVFEPTGDVQRYKYNGKEYIADGDLNWYDYGARHYDPAIGRFTTMDPLAEKYNSTSPYAYCLDNPVKYVDPLGTDTVSVNNIDGIWNITNVNVQSGNDVFNVTINGNTSTYTFSEGEYGNRMNILTLEKNINETLGIYHLSGTETAGYALQRGDPATVVSGMGKRIPVGLYNTYIGEGKRWPSYVGLYSENISSNRGIRVHYGTDYTWTEGCILLSSDYKKVNGRIKFDLNESRDAVWNYVQYLGATTRKLNVPTPTLENPNRKRDRYTWNDKSKINSSNIIIMDK